VVQNGRDQNGVGISVVPDQPQEISSQESMISQGKDVIGGIQPKFVYQSTSPNYYEPMEHWEVDENTNVDVLRKLKKITHDHLNT
jgi:hypothetical protein